MKKYIALLFILIFTAGSVLSDKAKKPQIRQIDLDVQKVYTGDQSKNNFKIEKATALDACSTLIGQAAWAYDKWVYGDEWYFAYIDPEITCPDPYPYGVNRIIFYMSYDFSQTYPTIDTFSIQLSYVDNSDINCPMPGDTIPNSVFSAELTLQEGGLWPLPFILNETVEVNEPFFVGIYIGDEYLLDTFIVDSDTSVYPKSYYPDIVTDDFGEGPRDVCRTLNIFPNDDGTWTSLALDTLYQLDVNDDTLYWFRGRMIIYVNDKFDVDPLPEVKLASPLRQIGSSILLYGNQMLWGVDNSGSSICESFIFEATNNKTSITEQIDLSICGNSILRDGINDNGNSEPNLAVWDVSNLLKEGYNLRIIATDALDRADTLEQQVLLYEPILPIPNIQNPADIADGKMFCDTIDFLYSNTADELDSIELFIQPANLNYLAKVTPLAQIDYGDVNGDATDGNSSGNNEFGDYYNAPVAAASVLNTWYNRGITEVMIDGTTLITIDTLVERLAQQFKTRENFGTYDEDLYTGLVAYLRSINNTKILLDFMHKPNYFDIRKKVEVENQVVLLALGNDPGKWVVVEGFKDWILIDGSFTITVMDPTIGTMVEMNFVNSFPTSTVSFYGKIQQVDLMVMLKSTDAVSYGSLVDADIDGSDDWAIEWIPTELIDNTPYFFSTVGHKDTLSKSLSELNSVLLYYTCSETFFAGDYNDDDLNNINDYLILQTYIIERTSPPIGGAYRADANGDNNINIADLIYYLNFLFGNVGNPTY